MVPLTRWYMRQTWELGSLFYFVNFIIEKIHVNSRIERTVFHLVE